MITSFINFRNAILPVIFLFFCSCGGNQQVDRAAIKKEMKRREIKRMTPSQIQLEGERIGQTLLSLTGDSLLSFMELYQLKSDTIIWNQITKDSTLSSILEVYSFAKEEGLPMPSGIQSANEKNLFYCSPLKPDTTTLGVLVTTIPRKELIINFEE